MTDDLNEHVGSTSYDMPDEPAGVHVMIDLGTWATGPAAVPIAIGAVKFLPKDGGTILDRFYVAIEPKSAAMMGLHVDPETIMWWLDPERSEVFNRWYAEPKSTLHDALGGFHAWYGKPHKPTWGNGAAFDNVILDTAFKVCNIPRPWGYKFDRDFRSIRALLPGRAAQDFGKHDALADAVWQAKELSAIVETLGLTLG